MSQPYVPIQAAPPPADDISGESPVRSQVELKKRRAVNVACNSCRRRRVRCDGQRPTCSNCRGRDNPCVYRFGTALLPETKKTVVEMIRLLNSMEPTFAMRLIAALATEQDATIILSTLRGESTPPIGTSSGAGAAAGADSLVFTLESPIAYPIMQGPVNSEAPQPKDDPNITSERDESDAAIGLRPPQSFSSYGTQPSTWTQPSYNLAESVPNLCDPRLQELDIGMWTTIQIDNDTAARCISLYLQTDHPLLGLFEPDLFISHLISGQHDYCTPLLVNALLYWACQMYSCIDSSTDQLTMPFCAEAERLWHLERDNGCDSVANIAAAEFLCLGYLGQGRDHVILYYVSEVSAMGIRLQLVGIEHDEARQDETHAVNVEDSERWRAHAAWGVFNWITLMSLFYRQPGISCPKHPPRSPIPEYSVSGEAGSEHALRQPLQFMGNTFTYLCQFWCIVHEVSLIYCGDGGQRWGCDATMTFAEYKFRELLAWSNCLPPRLSQGQDHPHHVQILHLWFHAAILDIFRPFIQDTWQSSRRLRTFNSKAATPSAICDASIAQLKHLISNYRQQHASSRYTFLWHTALIYVTNAIVNEKRDTDWYVDLLVCIYGYESLGRSWRVASSIAKSLLSLALQKGILPGRTARLILHDLQSKSSNVVPQEVRATFMADLNLAMSDPDSATVEQLARQFEARALLKDFTTVLDSEGGTTSE